MQFSRAADVKGAASDIRSLRVKRLELLVAVEANGSPRLRIATTLDNDGMSIARNGAAGGAEIHVLAIDRSHPVSRERLSAMLSRGGPQHLAGPARPRRGAPRFLPLRSRGAMTVQPPGIRWIDVLVSRTDSLTARCVAEAAPPACRHSVAPVGSRAG
jgi:hypothetical protein